MMAILLTSTQGRKLTEQNISLSEIYKQQIIKTPFIYICDCGGGDQCILWGPNRYLLQIMACLEKTNKQKSPPKHSP